MDDECAVCNYIQLAINNLSAIANVIDLSCLNQKKKKDFGLDKSFVMREVASVQQMLKYHQYFHSTGGESLNDGNSMLDWNEEKPKSKKFRKLDNDN